MPTDKPIGKVTHYYDKIQVAVLAISKPLKVGDTIRFEGHSNFSQTIDSIEIEHKKINSVKKGDEFGLKVNKKVQENDKVFKEE
jgi:putative protease